MKIEIVDVPHMNVIFAKATCKHSEIGQTLSHLFPKVANYMGASGAAMAGAPFCRYTAWRDEECDIEGGCPIVESLPGEGAVLSGTIGNCRAVRAEYVGPYDGLSRAHEACRNYMAENGLVFADHPFEIYITDPNKEPDPAKYITHVYWPVA
jgi:effector-binding domain-containing protein